MQLKYIDIHSHLNLKPLSSDKEGVITRMKEKKVGTITVGVDFETSNESILLAEEMGTVVFGATVGLHPTDNIKEIFDYEKYKALALHVKVVAIGECGLDYYRLPESKVESDKLKENQIKTFKKHVELAQEIGKPLMIHSRPSKGSQDAYEDVISILNSYNLSTKNYKLSGNFHFFVGNIEIAKQVLDRGFTMSFDGPITFTEEYDDVIRYIPLDMMHAETDAPFAAPTPYRGTVCEPWMVEEVVKRIAEIKSEPLSKIQEQFILNAQKLFKLR